MPKRAIPDHAIKVFWWVMFDVRHREQELFDGSITTFEAVARENTSCVFAVQWDKLIMCYQKQPQDTERYRDFPWWRVPRWKDMLAHAQLELKEETWMISNDREEYVSYDVWGKVHATIKYYIVRNVKQITHQSLDPWGEIIEVKSLDFETMIDMVMQWKLGDVYLRNDILLMKIEGRLWDFKKELFG